MHSFEVHSNESACRKSGRLGLEQVYYQPFNRGAYKASVQFLKYHVSAIECVFTILMLIIIPIYVE